MISINIDCNIQQPVEKARRRTLKWEKITAISKTANGTNGYNTNQQSQPYQNGNTYQQTTV